MNGTDLFTGLDVDAIISAGLEIFVCSDSRPSDDK